MHVKTMMILSVIAGANAIVVGAAEPAPQGAQAAANEARAFHRVEGWLKQFRNSKSGHLPATFSVKIHLDGYLNRETPKGIHFLRPREVYEFTPQEVRRLCLRATGVDKDGATTYRVDKKTGRFAYEVVSRKPFNRIDEVCRILLALNFLEMIRPERTTKPQNFHQLQVLTDSGLPPLGDATIGIRTKDTEHSYCEACVVSSGSSSEESIRFAALYHTLRRLARTELSLSAADWDDALDIIGVDGSLKPAAGTFRARE